MLLLVDGGLDDGGVEGVGDQADDNIDLCDLGLEGSRVGDIERDGVAVLQTLTELLCRLESSAGCPWLLAIAQATGIACGRMRKT